MKLAQLLAKELKEWPEGVTHLTQSEVGNEIYNALEGNSEGALDFLDHRFDTSSRHSERPYPIVSRDQWQAEREKMDKPKWIRHRGGNSTLHPGTMIEARLRSGEIQRAIAGAFLWDNSLSDHAVNIMAYRIIEETKDQEIEGVKKTNVGTITYKLEIDATEATKEIDSLVAKWGQIESPLKWRDAIIHCQAIIEDCEREIERNINLLDAEGLMMQKDSKKAMQRYAPDVDMSDWRNWKHGDIISISNDPDIKDGEYKVTSIEEYDYDGDLPVQVTNGWADFSEATIKFIRRP